MKKTFQKIKKQKAFTLIETLVAIAILMVAIAGPLNIAEKGLVSASNSKDQTIAAFLAEDLMEYVKNIRDSNIIAVPSQTWLNNLTGVTGSACPTGSYCVAETATGDYASPSSVSTSACTATNLVGGVGGCQLYISPTGYYTYSPTGNQATPFYRTFTVSTLASTPNSDVNNIRLVTVNVYWLNGSLENTYTLQNVIFNTPR